MAFGSQEENQDAKLERRGRPKLGKITAKLEMGNFEAPSYGIHVHYWIFMGWLNGHKFIH